jgi:TRAP-type C4-dicarboxylate transport system permease large subunit
MPQKTKKQLKKQLKAKQKSEPKSVSLTSRKSYWVMLTVFLVIFGAVIGLLNDVSIAAVAIMLSAVVSVVALAAYIKFTPSALKARARAIMLLAGAMIAGFLTWVAVVLVAKVTLEPAIGNAIGDEFFLVTSSIICLAVGAFIGDLIGKTKRVQTYFAGRF